MLTLAFLLAWLRAFVFTQLVEAPIYRKLLGVPWGVALGASAITHPILWAVILPIWHATAIRWWLLMLIAETIIWLIEAGYFVWMARVTWRRALVASLLANGASVALGQLSRSLFGLP